MTDLVVVGAGVVGASVAYAAARLGAAVTLVEADRPGCGVTRDSFAWIGASGVPPGPTAELRRAATREHRRLAAELPAVDVRWTGSLTWPYDPSTVDEERTVVTAEQVALLEPHLREPPRTALRIAGDGACDPVALTEVLVAGARACGARLLLGTRVTGLLLDRGGCRGVQTAAGPVEASAVVLAAGTGAAALCAPTGFEVPVTASPAVLVRLQAPPRLVRTLLATPDLEVRQAPDGTLLVTLEHTGEQNRDDLAATGRRALAGVRALLRSTEDVRLLGARTGWRPVPFDGEPLVGPVPGVPGAHLAVLHSAVSLAAVVGRLAARELVLGTKERALLGCRPDRPS